MKKYLLSILFGFVIGLFLSKMFLEEYHDFKGIKKVANTGVSVYFVKYGTYKTEKELESNTTKLINYIYTKDNDEYKVYIGITANKDNLNKLINYFKKLNYSVDVEEYIITSHKFNEYLVNADKLISSSSEESVLGEVSNQTLSKYEELVINDSKN